jgi:3-hydroxymyristoyl/3-hydroxydecanoyl-(acyl carrier protein) dehydratase
LNTATPAFAFPIEPLSITADALRYRVSIPAAPSFCRDHFPGQPLLPAYALLLFLRHTLSQTLDLRPASWAWQQLKFLHPILPNAHLTLEIKPGPTSIHIKLHQLDTLCFSGRFVATRPTA